MEEEVAAAVQPEEAPRKDASQLHFTILYGGETSTAQCSLLEISGVKFLLDCGWDSNYDPSLLEPLGKVAESISVILISHADLEHMGALAYAFKHFKLKAPIMCTKPVLKFGYLCLYDCVLNSVAPFSLDEVDFALSRCTECVYLQKLKIEYQGGEMYLSSRSSGRDIGGAIWTIMNEETSSTVVYTSDIYQRRERLLDGLEVKSLPKDPTLLIMDCLGLGLPSNVELATDDLLSIAITECLDHGGDVLIPVPCTSRIVDLFLFLNELWAMKKLTYELILLTPVSSLLGMAGNHVEWLSKRLQEQHDDTRLQFSQVRIVDSFEEAFPLAEQRRNRAPRLIVCGGMDMERNSFAREVFVRECSHRPGSLVLLLFQSLVKSSLANQLARGDKLIELEEERFVDLVGEELEEWTKKRNLLMEERIREAQNEVELEAYERAEEEDDEDDKQDKNKKEAASLDRTLFKDENEFQPNALVFTFVPSDVEERGKWDEYGAPFHAEDFFQNPDEDAQTMKPTSTTPTAATTTKQQQQDGSKMLAAEDLGPKKKETYISRVQVTCQVKTLNFDGRMGRNDLLEIVDFMKPRKLVAVRSNAQALKKFASDCQLKASCGMAFHPSPGEALDVAADSTIQRVRIPDETLHASPPPVSLGNFTIQRIKGRMALASLVDQQQQQQQTASNKGKRRKLMSGGEVPSILSVREGEDELLTGGESVWVSKVNEPNLTTVLRKLKTANIPVSLVNAVLLCGVNQEVQIWKPADGQLLVSGAMGDLYFETREIVYSCFALV